MSFFTAIRRIGFKWMLAGLALAALGLPLIHPWGRGHSRGNISTHQAHGSRSDNGRLGF